MGNIYIYQVKNLKKWFNLLLKFPHASGLKFKEMIEFLSDPGVPGVRSMGPDVWEVVLT